MAESNRGFREVDLLPGLCQYGQTRRRIFKSGLDTLIYRNNLTCLSQRRNLYFVAYRTQIHVFQPTFPEQHLPPKAAVKWELPRSTFPRPGYIDPHTPHGINQIAVRDFGRSEILVCVCDDGDVVAYTVRCVQKALDMLATSPELKKSDAVAKHVKPFLLRNVRASAWGIAVHGQARLIAVSANTHDVTVFAPAISWDEDRHDGSHFGDDRHRAHLEQYRTSDQEIVLHGHRENIPNLAFCNTADDPLGRFLVSTDIRGNVFVWDVWRRKFIRSFALPARRAAMPYGCYGWNVVCLEKQIFRLASGQQEFLGCSAAKWTHAGYDITAGRDTLKDSGAWEFTKYGHPMGAELGPGIGTSLQVDDDDGGEDDDINWLDSEAMAEINSNDFEQADNANTDFEMEDIILDAIGAAALHHPIGFGSMNTEVLDDFGFDAFLNNEIVFEEGTGAVTHTSSADADTQSHDTAHGSHQRSTPPSNRTNPAANASVLANHPGPSDAELDLPFLILHTGVDVVSLLEAPFKRPKVTCIDPCKQRIPANARSILPHTRLNLVETIPELGLVIVASQVGRVAIFTLTHLTKGLRQRVPTGQHGMRLDWVVPLASQEARGERPIAPLLGIAVAPVQGRATRLSSDDSDSPELPPDSQGGRWRLLLHYHDMTVLSYELWRAEAGVARQDDMLLL